VGARFNDHDMPVWEEFKEYVREQHGKLHTALGEELAEALRQYLNKKERMLVVEIRRDDVPAVKKDIDDLMMLFAPDELPNKFEALYYKVIMPLLEAED